MSNKDEAQRAKELAEDWMSKSDFTTARRIALKAQKMDASLENAVARMIMVCDVHCAALEKSGDETDWYKILQVEQNADENTIKKQYRKLALHLHPDKNKLPGAESAFKTIGEAQRILLDKDKRRFHDMRRKPVFRRPAPAPATSFQPQQAPTTPFFTQRVFQTNDNAARKRPENQKKPPTGSGGGSRFCTSCPFCRKMYEYQRGLINTRMNCLSCGKQYIAFQENFQGPTVQATFPFFQQSKVPTQEAGKAVEKQPESSAKSSLSKEGSRAKSSGVSAENINGKRKSKKVVEISDSSCSESSIECKEVPVGGQDSGSSRAQSSRRSVRSKQQVSAKESKSEDDNKKEFYPDAKAFPEQYCLNANNPCFWRAVTTNKVLHVSRSTLELYSLKIDPVKSPTTYILPGGRKVKGEFKLKGKNLCFSRWMHVRRMLNLKIGDSVVCELEHSRGLVKAVRVHIVKKD